MTRIRNTYLAAFAVLLSPMAANADLVVVGGVLQGATNVDVGGILYDVEFIDGICSELFDGCDDAADFTFQSGLDAGAASQALLNQVFVGIYDSTPALTRGCASFVCYVNTLYFDSFASFVRPALARNWNIEDLDRIVGRASLPPSTDLRFSNRDTFARWTLASRVTVPEPGTLALLAIGLLGLGLARRGRKQA